MWKKFDIFFGLLLYHRAESYTKAMKKRQTLTRPMLERIIMIHEMIKEGNFPSTTTLANEIEAGTATISRDIDFLRDRFYAPIEYDSSKKGYYYDKPFELPLNVLSEKDMEVLSLSKVLLSNFEGTPLYDELCSLIDFLAPIEKTNNSMLTRIAVPPVAKSFYDKETWTKIYDAMKTNQIVEFDYNGLWRTETTHRRVHPYQLVMDNGEVYLLGYSEERKAERLFSLARMSNMVITKDKFTLPDNYDFVARSNNGKFGIYFQEDKSKIKLRFYGISKKIIKEKRWADDQVIEDHKDYVDLTFTSNQQSKVLDWILSLRDTVEPLEPKCFVEAWKNEITNMAVKAGIIN